MRALFYVVLLIISFQSAQINLEIENNLVGMLTGSGRTRCFIQCKIHSPEPESASLPF